MLLKKNENGVKSNKSKDMCYQLYNNAAELHLFR